MLEHQVLDAWAADPYKRQEAIIIFRNAATGTAWETLHLKAAYCVSYNEVFVQGDVTSGSYRCFFTLSDPDGWTWNPGGPLNEAAIRPAPGEHGAPPSTAASMPPLRPTTELFQRGYEESLNPINPHRMALWIGYLVVSPFEVL